MSAGVVRETVLSTLREALNDAKAKRELNLTIDPPLILDVPKKESWGDLATTLAMNLSSSERRAPMEIAQIIAKCLLPAHGDVLERADVAPPGFINLTVKRNLWFRVLTEIEAHGSEYGSSSLGNGQRVLLEFVSANPTGPLHMGHGRGAAVGGALANLLRRVGYEVDTEFYINDAGRQVRLMAASVTAVQNQTPVPEDGYRGVYIVDLANRLRKTQNAGLNVGQIGKLACEEMLKNINIDLQAFGLTFDRWFSEQKELFDSGKVEQALKTLKDKGLLEERDGALWFKSSVFGDDKDRVVKKQDDEFTYLASDIAYHRDKLERRDKRGRGYDLLINIWGADHHGYIPRMEAAVQAFGYPKDRLHVVLVQIVNLLRGGQRITMSKRAGEMVTLKEVIEEVGADAAKFIFLTRRADSQLDFDLELARRQSAENPVYYVQYAHARVASLFRVAAERGVPIPSTAEVDWSVLDSPDDLSLIKPLADYPSMLEASAKALEPHRLTYYLQDLAGRLHTYYYKHRILPPVLEGELERHDTLKPLAAEGDQDRKREVLTPALTAARLCLFRGVQTVIRNGLEILGVSAPERM
ncbi:MAG: arginine--tRNA ligase [Nitrospirae bacterium]|nr:MAG: arginine--tRNA ligase [Nitrospirota bacterium]